jgi:hypothetical protein
VHAGGVGKGRGKVSLARVSRKGKARPGFKERIQLLLDDQSFKR